MIPLAFFSRDLVNHFRSVPLIVCLCAGVLVAAVSGYGYSTDYEGYLGETIALHGESYNSDQVYLFMTGPGLPENGVALTDPSQRADQGKFTTVDVDSSQQWSFRWDTSRIDNEIDPGTYTVYAVNAPVDKSDISGHSYQTLSVYLKDGSLSKDRVSIGTKYTMNLAYDDTPVTTTVTTVPPTLPPTTIVPDTTATTAVPASTPARKSAAPPLAALTGLITAGCIFFISKRG